MGPEYSPIVFVWTERLNTYIQRLAQGLTLGGYHHHRSHAHLELGVLLSSWKGISHLASSLSFLPITGALGHSCQSPDSALLSPTL